MSRTNPSLHLSDLNDITKSIAEKERSDFQFLASCSRADREISCLRSEVQYLMARANVYCKEAGVSIEESTLPTTIPRYRFQGKQYGYYY